MQVNNWLVGKQRKPSESYKSINMNSSVWSRFMDGKKELQEKPFSIWLTLKRTMILQGVMFET